MSAPLRFTSRRSAPYLAYLPSPPVGEGPGERGFLCNSFEANCIQGWAESAKPNLESWSTLIKYLYLSYHNEQ